MSRVCSCHSCPTKHCLRSKLGDSPHYLSVIWYHRYLKHAWSHRSDWSFEFTMYRFELRGQSRASSLVWRQFALCLCTRKAEACFLIPDLMPFRQRLLFCQWTRHFVTRCDWLGTIASFFRVWRVAESQATAKSFFWAIGPANAGVRVLIPWAHRLGNANVFNVGMFDGPNRVNSCSN